MACAGLDAAGFVQLIAALAPELQDPINQGSD